MALTVAVPPLAAELAAAHWPGPLTMVLRRRPGLGWRLGEPTDTIGVRCPDHDLVRALAARVGPLATTSANRHGLPTPSSALEAAGQLLGPVDLVLDGGPLYGTPSTVVDLTGEAPRVLRQGAVVIGAPDATGA
jgi:tRNA threonylcarbamoyl adenosine modification protein (Sua5/YciO/YrdC/YwlC family)